jgi:hypothetical protein
MLHVSCLQTGRIVASSHISNPCVNSHLSANPFVARPFSRIQPINTPLRSVKMAVSLKIKDYEGLGGFELPKEQQEALQLFLSAPDFCRQVFANSGKATVANKDTSTASYTGLLFQPVPWSPNTRKGMPKEMEKYSGDSHVIINIPPPIMFKANIYGAGLPNRLCAIFEIVPRTTEEQPLN